MKTITAAIAIAMVSGACSSDKGGSSSDKSGSSSDKSSDSTDVDGAKKTIRVTGIPDENPTELARSYQPMVELLSEALGTKVEYIPVTDYGAAVQALVAGKVDFAWLGGFTHVQARRMTEVVPLVMRDIDREFRSAFIASASSGVSAPKQLAGVKFAFGSKSSTSGHLMPRHFLSSEFSIDAGKDFDGPPVFSGAHDATAKMVESGKVAAGALNLQVWKRMVSEKAIDTTRVVEIWQTPPYVDYVWTARTAVPAEIRTKFSELFLSLDAKNPEHKAVLERMGAVRYVPAQASDFDSIEKTAKAVGLLK